MTDKPNDLLLLAGKVLTVFMQIIMAIIAAVIPLVILALIFAREQIEAGIAEELGEATIAFPLWPAVGVLALCLVAVAAIFVFFGKLRAIIGTVGDGDPFLPENATRLNLMAWLLLAVQLVSIPIAALGLFVADWANEFDNAHITIDNGLDLTGILMVIILFILARVFKHGAAMRDDLEGTV